MRRGFSLLELLVAVGLLVVIAALALPALWGQLHGARLDTALRQIGAAVTTCRAEAQRNGQPLELRVVQLGGGGGSAASAGSSGAQALVMEVVGGDAGEGESAGAKTTVVPWSVLPAGVRAMPRRPEEQEAGLLGGGRTGAGAERGAGRLQLDERSWRVGVFLPDGGVVTSGPVYLKAGAQTMEVTLNRWTGGATAKEVEEAPEEES